MRSRVLDTNVLLDRPFSEVVESFEPCNIVIPFAVIQELDKFKNSKIESLRMNSRIASNYIDKLRDKGKIYHGIELDSGHYIRVEMNHTDTDIGIEMPSDDVDTRIIKLCKGIQRDGEDVILCSQDTNQRIIADLVGIKSENYGEGIDLDNMYTGYRDIYIHPESINKIYNGEGISPPVPLSHNEFVVMRDSTNPKHTCISKYNGKHMVKVPTRNYKAFGISPLNLEQQLFMNLLMDPDISLVTAIGGAGSGKSLLSLATSIDQVYELNRYNKITVSRPLIDVGEPIGFLPGDEVEKISPWLKSMRDNLEFLVHNHATKKDGKCENLDHAVEDVMRFANIEVQALNLIRGRSLPNQIVIMDEAQNMSMHEVKTVVSRAGHNTKVVLIGDIEQIDNPRLNKANNGLVNLIESFREEPIHGHITLTKTERSELADRAIKLL